MNELTVHQPTKQWDLIQRQCKAFMESGFLPQHIKTPAQALTIAWKGHELGIPPLAAFSSIAVVKGKPCLSAELMRSLVFRKYPTARIELTTKPDEQHLSAEYLVQRPGGGEQHFKFTMEDAKKAGLIIPGSAWEKYPKAMLQARASAMACRASFAECLMGLVYTPEELGGEPIDVEAVETQLEAKAARNNDTVVVGNTPSYDARHDKRMGEPCTEPQRKKLYAMSKNLGWSKEESKEWLFEKFGVESSSELSKIQIQEAFEMLESGGTTSDEASFAESQAHQ